MFGGGTAQSEDYLAPGIEPEVVQARYGEEKHDEDEPIVNNDVL